MSTVYILSFSLYLVFNKGLVLASLGCLLMNGLVLNMKKQAYGNIAKCGLKAI